VTGGGDKVTGAAAQSETASTLGVSGGKTYIVVSYNDETGQSSLIKYPSSIDRLALKGASQMGWSYSDDGGKTWTHGGPVATPKGWSILWGDPAMATSGADKSIVFLSNLAVPDAKYPMGGVNGSFAVGITSPIGGACIAKSTDGGQNFSIWHCVSNKAPVGGDPSASNGHFYDGGALASTPSGAVYAAYVDVETGLIDVWSAPNASGSFSAMPTPFPSRTAVSHPRLRVGPDGTLYVGAQLQVNSGVALYISRWFNGAWSPATLASNYGILYPGIDFGSTVQGAELTVRTAGQFGYDVGTPSAGGNDAIRVMSTRLNDYGRLYIEGSACAADLTGCHIVGGWQIGPSDKGATPLDVYNPDVVAWWGDGSHPATWQTSFMERFGASTTTVNVARGTLGYVSGSALIIPVDIVKNTPVCSDTRGYWGDYDAMILAGFDPKLGGTWMRFYTDSSSACSKRWEYEGVAQHVSQTNYDY
jgi:hypothetical protein